MYPGAKEPITFKPITDEDRAEYFAKYSNSSLGRVKNLYMKWARIKGAMSEECQQLNRLFSQCVDGNRIKVPQCLEDPPDPSPEQMSILDILHEALHNSIKDKINDKGKWQAYSREATSTSAPTSTPKRNSTPSSTSCCTRRSTSHFSILKSGTPKRTSPPPASSRSNTVTAGPRGAAAARRRARPGPTPITATVRPVRVVGGCGVDPALVPRAVDDRELDLLDRDRVALVDLEHARGLARRRAEPAGELREVVRPVQLLGSPPASGRGRRGRSSRGSGSRAGSRRGRTARRTPCSARPARAARRAGACRRTRGSRRRARAGRARAVSTRSNLRKAAELAHQAAASDLGRDEALAAARERWSS